MNKWHGFLVLAFAIFIYETWYNSKEAHRHAHEIACAVDSRHTLCEFTNGGEQ